MEALDDIANAVTEVLMVFEEAQSDYDTNIIVEAKNLEFLVQSINSMVDEKRKIATQIDDEHLRGLMNQSNIEIANACDRLERLIRAQPNGLVSRSAYKPLHDELKTILQHMISQLKITDQVNVGIMLKTAKRNLDAIARMKNVDTLTGLVSVAREASKNGLDLQIQLKSRIAETTDQTLRRRLVDASEQLRTSSPIAIAACQNALEAPSSENTGKKDRALRVVLEALKEIIDVIQISAQMIENYLLQFGFPELTAKARGGDSRTPRVNQELARLEDAVRRNDHDAAQAAMKALKEETKKQVDRGRDAAKTMTDPERKGALLKDCDLLTPQVDKVIDTAKSALQGNQKARNDLPSHIADARNTNNRIEDALKPEKAFLDKARALNDALNELRAAVDRGDKDRAVALMKDIIDRMQKEAALARALAEQIRDPASKKRAFDAIDDFEAQIPRLVQALKETLENPDDRNARARFDGVIDRIKDDNNKIAREILEDQLAKNNEMLRKKLGDLQDAVRRGDAREVAELLKDIADLVARRVELGRQLANTVKDPAIRKQILDACDDLERLMPELVIAAREAVQNPNDAAAQDRLRRIIQEMKDAADRITSLKKFADKNDNSKGKLSGSFLQMGSNIKDRDHTAEDVIATGNALNQAIERLRDAVHEGDAKAAAAAAKEVADLMNRQIELGRRLASQCEDPALKKKILDACDELERLVPLVVNAVKDALMHPDDKNKRDHLDRLLDQAKAANKVIMDAAEQMRSHNKKINDIAANMKDKMSRVDTQYPESKFDGSKDQIMFAANNLKIAVRAAKPVSPEQKLLMELVAAIAAEMEAMSLAGQRKQKKEMVASARKIAGMVDKVQSLSTQIATSCKDPILRDQLLSLCRVPKNFAVQLKIISAVKASSGDDDAAAEAQLITCAKGLANSVVSTLTAAEAAAIP